MTRCGTSPDRSAGGRSSIAGDAGTGRLGFCITMPPLKASVAPSSRSTLSAGIATGRSSWCWMTTSSPSSPRRPELHQVGVRTGLLTVDLDPEREAVGIRLGGAGLQHLGPGFLGDGQQLAHTHHDRWVPRVLLLLPTSTYRAPDFVRAAASLGVEVVVGSEEHQALASGMGDRAVVVPLGDPEAAADVIVALHRRTAIDAVVAVDDQGVLVAAAAGERLGFPHNPPEAVAATPRQGVDAPRARGRRGAPA